jgi:hypothetical protein
VGRIFEIFFGTRFLVEFREWRRGINLSATAAIQAKERGADLPGGYSSDRMLGARRIGLGRRK